MNDGCIIPLNGWTEGRKEFQVSVGKEFFEAFDNSEILDANVRIDISVEKSLRVTDVDLELSGTLTVPCDRCLEDLVIPVETSFEESYTPETDELDLRQDVYDFVCISLPLQRVHPEGECNQETTKYLSK